MLQENWLFLWFLTLRWLVLTLAFLQKCKTIPLSNNNRRDFSGWISLLAFWEVHTVWSWDCFPLHGCMSYCHISSLCGHTLLLLITLLLTALMLVCHSCGTFGESKNAWLCDSGEEGPPASLLMCSEHRKLVPAECCNLRVTVHKPGRFIIPIFNSVSI